MKTRGAALPLMGAFLTGFAIMLGATVFAPANAAFIGPFNPLCRVFEFVLGMATCRLWLGPGREQRSIVRWSGLELAAIVITLGAVVFLPQLLHDTGRVRPFLAWLELEFCAVVFAVVIWTFAHQAGAISKVLSARAFEWSGEISFALYMSHQILLRWLDPHLSGAWESLLCLLGYTAAAVALAAAIFHLVETPARHAIVSAFKRARKRRAPG
jgi:peptidoglycan/LPS O-acetylase OafA/YrhL